MVVGYHHFRKPLNLKAGGGQTSAKSVDLFRQEMLQRCGTAGTSSNSVGRV